MSPKVVELEIQNLPLESGFTPTEIVALQNGWRLLKRSLHQHSSKIATDFFRENYFLLDVFRHPETKKFDMTKLHQHTHQMTNFYGRLIENGIGDVVCLNMLMVEVVSRHKMYGVTPEHIKLITSYMENYILNFLEKIKSITFVNGLAKLSVLIADYHRHKPDNEDNITPNEV